MKHFRVLKSLWSTSHERRMRVLVTAPQIKIRGESCWLSQGPPSDVLGSPALSYLITRFVDPHVPCAHISTYILIAVVWIIVW